MSPGAEAASVAAAAAITCAVSTWVVRRLALAAGVVDSPDGRLKRQESPVPLLGGVAVYLAFAAALVGLVRAAPMRDASPIWGLLAGATILLAVGIVDDVRRLGWQVKLVVELVVAMLLAHAGVRLQIEFLPTWLNYLGSAMWLVGVANAVNLIDVMDGLASGTCAVIAATFVFIGLATHNAQLALASAALAGALLGFLGWNWRPARIYLGDAGSLFVGFALSALAMWASYTVRHRAALGVPLLVLGVPLFEMAFLVVMRLRARKSPFRGSPDHFALRLKNAGRSVPAIVLGTMGESALLGSMGILAMFVEVEMTLGLYAMAAVFGYFNWRWLAALPPPEGAP